jgi:hypothetical protein
MGVTSKSQAWPRITASEIRLVRRITVTKDEVQARLRLLTRLTQTVWLDGGISADFHVGRWTRDHGS